MMPSAALPKTEKVDKAEKPQPVPFEAPEPLNQVLTVLKNKSKNLERRKCKLERYKIVAAEGKVLTESQQAAMGKCDEVASNIELLRDLSLQFTVLAEQFSKTLKEKVNQDFADRHIRELDRMESLLKVQDVLSGMGDDVARADFTKGQNGALLLTAENLTLLDQIYKMATPQHVPEVEEVDGVKQTFETELKSAAAHLVHLLNGRKRKVLGTTYKELKALVESIHESGYFTLMARREREREITVEEEVIQPAVPAEPEYVEPQHEPQVAEEVEEVMEAPVIVQEEEPEYQDIPEPDTVHAPMETFDQQTPESAEDYSIFSTFTHNPPYTEVLSGTLSSFNFLQESEIDLESPHMDPAVIAAHPMIPTTAPCGYIPPRVDSTLISQFAARHGKPAPEEQEPDIRAAMAQLMQPTQHALPAQQIPSHSATEFSQIPTQTFTNQKFVAMPTFGTPVYGHVQQQQQVSQPAVTSVASVPTPIEREPMTEVAQPKRHFMNVNAPDFQALSYKRATNSAAGSGTGSNGEEQVEGSGNGEHGLAADNDEDQPTNNGRGNYAQMSAQQQQYQNRGNWNNGNRGGRGAPRGGGGGNSSRGGPASINGYMGTGGRGGGSRPGSGFAAGRGGGPSAGYQGYREGASNNNYYQNSYQRGNGASAYTNGGGNGNYNKQGSGQRGEFQ